MLRVGALFTLVSCLSVLAAACPPVLAQVLSPSSRTSTESTNYVTLKGYALSAGQKVTIEAVDQNTGNLVTLGTIAAATSGISYATSKGVKYELYPWTYESGLLAANYWAPQSIVPFFLPTSQGHLDLRASIDHNTILPTFSQSALSSLKLSLLTSHDFLEAAKRNSDGNSTVLFDQDGVGSGPPTSWVIVQGAVWKPPSSSGGFLQVAWSVGSYTVENGKKIYALICSPVQGGPYPVVIYNHGGLIGLSGTVTAAGGTPANTADELGQCIDWAKRGWVVAMSAYRGEHVSITQQTASPPTPPPTTWTSDGFPELCLGEVTDVLALTDLVVNHASSITVGSATQPYPINVNGKAFMYGWSHGGCITYRAVEQGAPVTAFAVIEGFADFRLTYVNGTLIHLNPQQAANGASACLPCLPGDSSYYYPDASGVMLYNWRSAHYFASRGDLSIQKFKTMPIMIFHGDVDSGNPVWLDEAVEMAADIGATDIYVGATGFSLPPNEPCILDATGGAGEPIVDSTTTHALLAQVTTCPISFKLMDAGDPCESGGPTMLRDTQCKGLPLPLTPPPGQAQQLRYLVVYHGMDHFNGGLAIENTFDNFAQQNFGKTPGCDGVNNGVNSVCNAN